MFLILRCQNVILTVLAAVPKKALTSVITETAKRDLVQPIRWNATVSKLFINQLSTVTYKDHWLSSQYRRRRL